MYEAQILPSPPTPLPSLGAARARRVPRRFSETRQRGARAGGEGGVRANHTPIQQRRINNQALNIPIFSPQGSGNL
jgi:hypothetical protein